MAGRGRKRGRRKRHSFAAWSLGKKIGVIFGGVAFAVLSTAAVLLAGKMSKIETTKIDTDKLNISSEVEHEEGYTNIALFGLDSRENSLGKGNRSDTIMIASLNNETKEVKLVSIYRDTLLQLDDGSYNKANSAYSFYGPEGAISMINKNLDMNIEKYVTVNFNALVDVIDAVGGLDIEMTEEEVVHMNNYCVETSEVTGKSYTKIEPEVAGTYHLNGVQAVSYSRIRYTAGGDFERASRQRHVLELIANEAQSMSLGTINKIIDEVFPQISTNFTLTEMVSYAKDFAKYTLGDSLGFPSKNTTDMLNEVGSVVIPDTLSTNVQEVHQFCLAMMDIQSPVRFRISNMEFQRGRPAHPMTVPERPGKMTAERLMMTVMIRDMTLPIMMMERMIPAGIAVELETVAIQIRGHRTDGPIPALIPARLMEMGQLTADM